ncbi:hypothetical protein T484DRAFT_1761715 [Baffinella frigidus]|nr:hypothetical protein T484DRAFT_1761715 [Cryptophyta sp. CCMP2293]
MDASGAGTLSDLEAVLVGRAPPVQDLVEMMIRNPPARHALKSVLSRRLLAHHRESSAGDASALDDLAALARGGHAQWCDALWDWTLAVLLDIEEMDPDAGGAASLEERHEARTAQAVPAALAALACACLDGTGTWSSHDGTRAGEGEGAALREKLQLLSLPGDALEDASAPASGPDARMLRLLRAMRCVHTPAAQEGADAPPRDSLDWLLVLPLPHPAGDSVSETLCRELSTSHQK